MKSGLELEYWIVDGKGDLASATGLANKLDFAEQEFVQPLFEVKTSPSSDLNEIREQLKNRLREAVNQADRLDLSMVPTGTPLKSGPIDRIETKRGKIQQVIVGDRLDYAKHVAGTHIHLEQEDVVRQFNTFTALDPALSLLNSSSYHGGRKVASNARNHIYRNLCYRDFPGHGQLWDYISSPEDWKSRAEKMYKKFRQDGEKRGIDPSDMDEYFNPGDALWTPVRIRQKFGTVEWRAPDTTLPGQVLELLRQIQEVMSSEPELPDFRQVREKSRESIRSGLGKDVAEYLERLGMDPTRFKPFGPEIESGDSISMHEARKIRLDAAKKLRQDIQSL